MSASPLRPFLVALLALAVVGSAACGGRDRQEKLSKAIKARAAAREKLEDARKELSKAENRLAEAQTDRERATKSVQAAERALSEAEAKVGLYATDDELFRHVQKLLLEDPALKDGAISASVKSGVVTLSGHVPDAKARDHAIELARGVPGVVDVKSELVIPSQKGAGNGSTG
jgi:hyperosmotically inducible protein